MMKLRMTMLALASLALAGTAQAEMVAGWDFSQYGGSSFLAIDSGSSPLVYANELEANYPDLDPSFGAGRNRSDDQHTTGSTPIRTRRSVGPELRSSR